MKTYAFQDLADFIGLPDKTNYIPSFRIPN